MKKLYEEAAVKDIANAIREKTGGAETYRIAQMGAAVRSIPDGDQIAHADIPDYVKDGVLALALLFSVTTAVLGSVFIDPLLALLGTRSTDGALYAATRDYLQILVAATPLFYLSNVFNYYLRNDGSQRRAGAGSVIGNLCDIALNITLVLALLRTRREGKQGDAQVNIKKIFPWFVLLFLVASIITTLLPIPAGLVSFLKSASKFFIVMALSLIHI